MKRNRYEKIKVAEIFDGVDHRNHRMTDIGVVGGQHKGICYLLRKIQRFKDSLECRLWQSCREEGDRNTVALVK